MTKYYVGVFSEGGNQINFSNKRIEELLDGGFNSLTIAKRAASDVAKIFANESQKNVAVALVKRSNIEFGYDDLLATVCALPNCQRTKWFYV